MVRLAACSRRQTVDRTVQANSIKKIDIAKQGMSSVKNAVVKQNLMGVSSSMEKKDWKDSQGRSGKVLLAMPPVFPLPMATYGSLGGMAPHLLCCGGSTLPAASCIESTFFKFPWCKHLLHSMHPARAACSAPRAIFTRSWLHGVRASEAPFARGCRDHDHDLWWRCLQGYGVYRFAKKYGANVDGYSPIYTPDTWSESGNSYKFGSKGLLAWCVSPTPVMLPESVGLRFYNHDLWVCASSYVLHPATYWTTCNRSVSIDLFGFAVPVNARGPRHVNETSSRLQGGPRHRAAGCRNQPGPLHQPARPVGVFS